MKVSLPWLKELVKYDISDKELVDKLSLTSIGIKDQTDDYMELDLTYNRGDLLSMRGVAHEIASITNSPELFSETVNEYTWDLSKQKTLQPLPTLNVKVDNELASVYCLVKIEGLKVRKSGNEWAKKLEDSGIRPVNNITDVTNIIMLEYGQPLHAFDSDKLESENIVVERAKKHEKMVTLDGKIRELEDGDILITDSHNIIGLAGIMGGKDSEISVTTTSILLEAAIFNPIQIRKTSRRLRISSEASKRFQHGLVQTKTLTALNAAIQMYQQMGGQLTKVTIVAPSQWNDSKKLTLTKEKTESLIGVQLSPKAITNSLEKLNFKLNPLSKNKWEVITPFWRQDIQIEEDLIEEVARIYGYQKIEGSGLTEEKIPELDQSLPKYISDLKLKLKDLGLTEAQSYSFYSVAVLEALGFDAESKKHLVRVANPISSETEYLRMDLWPNLVEIVGKNIRQGYKDIAIFEIGKVYLKEEEKPVEKYRLAICLMNGTDNPIAELSALMQNLEKIKGTSLNPSYFHPVRIKDGMGEVHLRLLNKLGIEKRVAVMEIDLEPLV